MTRQRIERRTFLKDAATGLAVASTLGFPAVVQSDTKLSEVRIAAAYPLTGPLGFFGQGMIRGWNIAVEEVNAAGGIKSLGGAKIETVLRDTQGVPRVGMAEIEKIAQDKSIPLMAGCFNSTVTYPATQISEQYRLPHLVEVATQTDIMRRGFKYVFRYAVANERSGEHIIGFVEDMAKVTGQAAKRAVIISVDDNFGKDLVGAIKNLSAKRLQIVEEIFYPLGVTNVDVEVARIKAAKPDVIFIIAFLNDLVLITRALHAQKVEAMGYVSIGGIVQPEYPQMVGDLANYFCAVSKFDYDRNRPVEREFEAKMMARYSVHSGVFSAILYGIVYLIKDVLERAGTIDREKVREAIATTNITTGGAMIMPGRSVRFDERGENVGATELIAQRLKGDWHSVWPLDWKRTFDAVWPAPKWEGRKA